MSIFNNPQPQEDKVFELVPEGKHPGVLRFFVDCGHHKDVYNGVETLKHIVFVAWELGCKDSEGNNHWKGDFYTASDFLHPKTGNLEFYFADTSNFNKLLRAWTGEKAEKVKWLSFVANLIAKEYPATISIEHVNGKNDPTKVYSVIESVKPYKGKEEIHRVGDYVGWTFGDEGFDNLPSMVKRKIEASIEKTVPGGFVFVPRKKDENTVEPPVAGGYDDSVPF